MFVAGCQWSVGGGPGCTRQGDAVPLPEELDESSGVAVSALHPGIFWSHNDSGSPPLLVAVDRTGAPRARVEMEGATNRDWEDMATGSCRGGRCLYVADVGDNAERRDDLALYRVREPEVLADTAIRAESFPIALPDGPRNIEAMFALPGERVYFVTKGSSHPVELYRYPGSLSPGEAVTLERVQFLSTTPPTLPNQITGASASADGRMVALRSYSTLRFYRVEGGRLTELDGGLVNLRVLGEVQGEGVALGADGIVALTSEGGQAISGPGGLLMLRCEVE